MFMFYLIWKKTPQNLNGNAEYYSFICFLSLQTITKNTDWFPSSSFTTLPKFDKLGRKRKNAEISNRYNNHIDKKGTKYICVVYLFWIKMQGLVYPWLIQVDVWQKSTPYLIKQLPSTQKKKRKTRLLEEQTITKYVVSFDQILHL